MKVKGSLIKLYTIFSTIYDTVMPVTSIIMSIVHLLSLKKTTYQEQYPQRQYRTVFHTRQQLCPHFARTSSPQPRSCLSQCTLHFCFFLVLSTTKLTSSPSSPFLPHNNYVTVQLSRTLFESWHCHNHTAMELWKSHPR